MGQKVNPVLFRLGINRKWNVLSYYNSNYSSNLLLDIKIRQYLINLLYPYNVTSDNIRIKKHPWNNRLLIQIKTLQGLPNISKELIKEQLQLLTGYKNIYIQYIRAGSPISSATLVAKYIASLLEKRKHINVDRLIDNKDKIYGYRVKIGGRINGIAKARKQEIIKGSLPLQKLNLGIDYGFSPAKTKYGILGVKVWIFYKER